MESSWGSPCSLPEWVDPSPSPPAPNQPLLPSAKCPAWPGSQLNVSKGAYCQHVQKPCLENVVKSVCCWGEVCLGCTVVIKATDTMDPTMGAHLHYIDISMHTERGGWAAVTSKTKYRKH